MVTSVFLMWSLNSVVFSNFCLIFITRYMEGQFVVFDSFYKTLILGKRNLRIFCSKTKNATKGFLPETIRNRLYTRRLAWIQQHPLNCS